MRGTGVGYGVNHAEGAKIYIIYSSDIGGCPSITWLPEHHNHDGKRKRVKHTRSVKSQNKSGKKQKPYLSLLRKRTRP